MRYNSITWPWREWLPCLLGAYLLGATTATAQTNSMGGQRVVLSESERAWVQKHPVVRYGVDPRWPPFSSFDKHGRISGINVAIVRLIATRTGLNIQLVKTTNWSETLRKASTGEIDFVGGIARTEQRERLHHLRFTDVFCKFPTAIVTRMEMPFLTSLEELKSKRIALPRDYATTEELRRLYPDTPFLITDNEEQSMLQVADGQADATVLNVASAFYVTHMRGLSNLKISGFSELDFFLSLAVPKGAPELRSILDKGLGTINEKEKEMIYARYILPETRNAINWRVWRRWTIFSVLAGTAGLTALLFWNRTLVREIRQREAAESALLQAKDKSEALVRELDRRARKVQALNDQLTSSNKDLESFSHSVSHDLKSPLRRLLGFADLLEEDAKSSLDSRAWEYLGAIRHEIGRMTQLIEALLAFARIGTAQMHLTPVNLNELVRDLINEMAVETKGREIIWDIHPLPQMECDRWLIKQVLANLIDNAVKFSRGRAPARIEIGTWPEKKDDNEVVFYVRDNGAGFEAEHAGQLFETFRRLHRQDEYEGTGIGLANVKRIIQKHGGRVWAEGEVDKGAAFYFSLVSKQKEDKGSS